LNSYFHPRVSPTNNKQTNNSMIKEAEEEEQKGDSSLAEVEGDV
jgi:hypothetical protein